MKTIWEDLGSLIDTLPPEEQDQYRAKLQTWVHDFRGKLGVSFSAIGILERRGGPEMQEILQMMRENFKQTLADLEEIRQVYSNKA